MQQALIIFVRNPELGKVKTRIAQVAGDAVALHVYKKLLAHTHAITSHLPIDKFVYYAEKINYADIWHKDSYYKAKQEGPELGTRMFHAFSSLYEKGYKQIGIIGSDCFQLTSTIIENAFLELNKVDVVIGPATDGGYYLLGMKNGVKDVFQDIDWSTDKVLHQTILRVKKHYTFSLLPELSDVDTVEDLPEGWLSIQ